MARLLYATIVGLVGAVLVHLAIVLMLPLLSANDVWRQILATTDTYHPVRLDKEGNSVEIAAARSLDPMFAVIACRYDLADGPLRINAPGNGDFWSVVVFDDFGRIVFSANDRIVATDALDVVVAEPLQLRLLQQNPRAEMANSILTEASRPEGFVIVRAFRPDDTWEPAAEEFLRGIDCHATPL